MNLQAVNKAMGNFIGIASHDLRSPLASIMGYSKFLSENWESLSEEERRNTTATIARHVISITAPKVRPYWLQGG